MTDTTATPNRAKAALVKIDPAGGPSVSIPFQYNPDSLRRSLQPTTVGGQPGGHSETVRFTGAPTEIITLNVELEGFDDLPSPAQNTAATTEGVYPLLYVLETLIYPPSAQIQQVTQQLSSGVMEIAAILAPPVLFVWGANRVAPVVVQSMEITEQAFDTQLSPLRAVVALTLRVVSYSDIISTSAVYGQYIQYQQGKETLAAQGHS